MRYLKNIIKEILPIDDVDETKQHQGQRKGGTVSAKNQDMSKLGKKGGKAAQKSGNAHKLTKKEQHEGGKK